MSEHPHFPSDSEDVDRNDCVEQDDIREVLATLQRLAENTRHPVVRACLEQAYDDIIHLTAGGEEPQAEGGPAAAA